MRPVLTLLLVLLGGAIQVCSAGAEETSKGRSNRLIQEKSPYLLQHAYNPVDWYPWGEEAFRLAREENRPIFLSVGYSTCYWCHVMEREVFENPGIADLMNRYFVNIKVDREERPDVDRIYMSALQALTGSGGWPMSMFLTPELEPFFGRTYVPPETFRALIGRIHEVWVKNRDDIAEAGRQLTEFLREQARVEAGDALLGVSILKKGYESIRAGYDETYGGFGRGNKFPRPVVFNFLLRYHRREAKSRALEMTLTTLKGMATSGIFDHLEGGFHRYSVDRQWRVPHFEKMLYDQAQLVNSYLEAYQSTRNPLFASMARRTLDYVSRRLTHPPGGFYSAEDAESATDPSQPDRKREGAFYVWTQAELDRILGPERGAVFAHSFGVEPDGNAPSDPHQVFVNQNILYRAHSLEETARKFKRSPGQVESVLEESRRRLLQTRNQRLRPHLDDKILVSWNGLMISAFARAHQVLGEAEYLEQARRAADFIMEHLYQQETGRLLRRYREGEARFEAHLEDYAFLVMGLIDLYQAGSDIRDLQRSMELTETAVELFYDQETGAFFDTSGRDASLILRTRDDYDAAEPAGNSVAVWNLLRLAEMTHHPEWKRLAEAALKHFGNRLRQHPQALPHMLAALDFHLGTPKQVVLAGDPSGAAVRALLEVVHSTYVPNKVLLFADGGTGQEYLGRSNPAVRAMVPAGGKATAYVCENYVCRLPTSEPEVLARLLEEGPGVAVSTGGQDTSGR